MELRDLIHSIDIVEFLSQYVDLEKRGDEYWGLSPFKQERTPSFSVRGETCQFYDYSSGIGGNVFTFIKYYFKCSTSEAVRMLSEYAGINPSTVSGISKISATTICKKFACNKESQPKNDGVVLQKNIMDRYEQRDDKTKIWRDEGISKASMDRFGVRYDSFSDRIVYPIKDVSGDIVNIGGRTLDKDFKEKGVRKYTYFYHWGVMSVVYGLFDNMEYIKDKKEIIIFEGCKSVLLADTYGFHNTGAILTSHLNPNQMKVLISLQCRVVFALDKDVKIEEDRNIQKLKHFVCVEIIKDKNNILSEKDAPVDKGKEAFETLYNERVKLI